MNIFLNISFDNDEVQISDDSFVFQYYSDADGYLTVTFFLSEEDLKKYRENIYLNDLSNSIYKRIDAALEAYLRSRE